MGFKVQGLGNLAHNRFEELPPPVPGACSGQGLGMIFNGFRAEAFEFVWVIFEGI